MIFLGRGLKNHFSLRSRRERKADKTPPFANSSVTLATCVARTCSFAAIMVARQPRGGAESMALIYIVEDDEPIRRELADILARAGFEVEACESFEHVSRDILAAAPDLVLLDLTLPVKDG